MKLEPLIVGIYVGLVGLGQGQSRPNTCSSGSSTKQILTQSNVWCGNMGQITSSGDMETCCPSSGSEVRRLLLGSSDNSKECRTVETNQSYCDESITPGCTTHLSALDVLTIDLEIQNQGSAGSCCDVCKCFGDPSCISFSGVSDEWVICDGHRRDCKMKKKFCVSDLDHAGNRCVWLKDNPNYKGWAQSGSPCQANWALSGYPTMVMYDTGRYKLSLTLGERGVIMAATMQTNQGNFTLEADRCFEYDPRNSSTPELAWMSESGQGIPSNWMYHLPNSVETWWQTVDEVAGVVAEISCTKSEERPRLDIQGLYETSTNRPSSSTGFCVTNTIQQKSGSTALTSEIYEKCLEENAPDLLVMCKFLVDEACSVGNMENLMAYWCENADVARTSAKNIEQCKSMIIEGTEKERKGAWTSLVCEANQIDITQCRTDISQFGWASFLETHSDGLVSEGNPVFTCAENFTAYETNGGSCEKGLQLQYFDSVSGDWVDSLFVPYMKPPCGNQMQINAAEMPELFTNRVRFQQCGLSAQCVVQNACTPASGFSTSFSYQTSSCPTPMPTEAPTDLPTSSPTSSPTAIPTESPTLNPTEGPTPKPTEAPSDAPTLKPTSAPSSVPTLNPTEKPTEAPTLKPTELPTSTPTELPTRTPTNAPTVGPTESPTTGNPSEAPTLNPTEAPTTEIPSEAPTFSPTKVPSLSPTSKPTELPTNLPTLNPTKEPTKTPTEAPTKLSNCTDIMSPGKQVSTLPNFSENFEVFLDVFFNNVTCGKGDIILMQIGCSTPFFSIKVLECTTALEVVLASSTSLNNACTPLAPIPPDTPVTVRVLGENGTMTVYYDNVEVCNSAVAGSVLEGQEVCVYEGSPDGESADACIDLGSVTSSSTTRDKCTMVEDQQTFCDYPDEMMQLGACDGECPTPTDLVTSPAFTDTCRELTISKPYCDLTNSEQKAKCGKLKDMDGVLNLEITVDESSTPQSCCQSCTCFGDPQCVAFDGSQDNWILCDARTTDCIVRQDLCSTETDHAGNTCKWDAARAKAMTNRADIGAIGSPCQPDWAKSGAASMLMYTRPGLTVSITAGERGVIETLIVEIPDGIYTLVADKCFNGPLKSAWEASSGSPDVDSVLIINYKDGAVPSQKAFEIVDPSTNVFIRVLCLQQVSRNGKYKNARLDIQNLVEPTGETGASSASGGYCTQSNAVIDKGLSTYKRAQEVHDYCQQTMQSSFLFCKALYSPSCTVADVASGVSNWCKSANLFPNDPNRIEKCIQYINPNDSNANRVTQRWSELYCQAVEYQRPPGVSLSVWVKQCVSRLQTDGYETVIEELGQGTFTASMTAGSCGTSEEAYGKRTAADACVPGISVEYQSDTGDWVEEFFVPFAFQPCEGKLQVTAKNHYNLFVHPVRFRQCSLSLKECPADVSCVPNFGYSVGFEYSQSPALCFSQSRRV